MSLIVAAISILIGSASALAEPRKDPTAYLKSDGERKLDIVYKETPQGKLQFDLYYPSDESRQANVQCPVIIYTPRRRLGGRQ